VGIPLLSKSLELADRRKLLRFIRSGDQRASFSSGGQGIQQGSL
jgi:hypothetical protein